MEATDHTATALSPLSISSSPLPSSPPPPRPPTNPSRATPCAACKLLRRRCSENCILAPYFPPWVPLKFATAHRVFGASNVVKFLQDLPENQRADAVNSMVYEANARIKDPIYGCAGIICHLHKQVMELQTQLTKARVELANMQSEQSNVLAFICNETKHSSNCERVITQPLADNSYDPGLAWEPLWT